MNVVPGWMPSGWDEPEPEPGAYGIFQEAMRDWKKNVVELSTMEGTGSRNRMLFVTLYSILEAYLSDTIIGSAMEDVGVQRKMLKLEGLKEKQISLETILDKPDIVREMVKTTLQGLSFHKLAQVNGMCEAAFGKPILPGDRDERALVMKSIDKRHDCVHRNGVTKEGTKHDDITSDYLLKLGALFENMGGNAGHRSQPGAGPEVCRKSRGRQSGSITAAAFCRRSAIGRSSVNSCRLAPPTRVVHDGELTYWVAESFLSFGRQA
ncbi:hypothetical protein GOL32_32450 [Sinorhizobium medicae]|nr:hypothetical protein [Sinorhizobium medicae]